MSGRLAISASARGMAEDSSSSRQMQKTTKTYVIRTDSQGNVTTHTDVQVFGLGSSASMRRYEEQIRVLQEDLESEMTLRRRVEHEKQGLQMQVLPNHLVLVSYYYITTSPDYLSVRASH